ncbi:oocyte zinc finger protein XlCOF6-like isoform X2 [Oncorhynchus nerka]|uniref:oocyte zinc finger protein XlCOF6-like isoform X2 n=1 Tax=Oncorhynchus nerka TaxID=8023 RepID=UPI0031B7F126
MEEDSEDPSSPSSSCSTEPQPTVSPGPDRNQEDSNHGDQKDTPQCQERFTVSLDINSETPTFNIVVKEEEDWELDNTGESPSHHSAAGESPSISVSGEPEQHQMKRRTRQKKTHPCPDCGKHCQTLSALQIHMRTHTGEKPYTCSECGKGFTHQCSLRCHHQKKHSEQIKTDPDDKIGCCCGQEFSSKNVLEVHLKTNTGDKPYTCCVCKKTFTHKALLKVHQRSHTGEKPFSCSLCEKSFTQKGNLTTHEKSHAGEKHPCSVCGKSFTQKGYLKIHQRLHCSEGELSSSVSRALEHRQRRAKATHRCPDCGKEFPQTYYLDRHMRTHTGERPYQCSVCGMSFTQKGNLKTHQKVHTGDYPSSSWSTGEGSPCTSGEAEQHQENHADVTSHGCLVCGEEHSNLPELHKHMRSHSGEKRLVCPVCGKTYPREFDLKVHLRTHTGEKPHECIECGKSFVRKQGLRQHQRTHEAKPIGPTRQLGRPKHLTRAQMSKKVPKMESDTEMQDCQVL